MSSIQRKIFGKVGRVALLAVCAMALSAVSTFAQDNSGPPPQGGPGGGYRRGMGRGPGRPGGPGRMDGRMLERMAKQLDLTPDQVSQIKGIHADAGKQMMALRDDTSLAKADKRQKMFSIMQDSQSKVLGLLTEEQKTKWQAMEAKMKERREEHRPHNGGGPPPPPQ